MFYPTPNNTVNDPSLKPPKESICYLTPVWYDDSKNTCFEDGYPTGKCPVGTIKVKQDNYYTLAEFTYNIAGLKPNYYAQSHIHENGNFDLRGLYTDWEFEG